MGERIEFPTSRRGCAQWRRAAAPISLTVCPACAALARTLAGSTGLSPEPVADPWDDPLEPPRPLRIAGGTYRRQ